MGALFDLRCFSLSFLTYTGELRSFKLSYQIATLNQVAHIFCWLISQAEVVLYCFYLQTTLLEMGSQIVLQELYL